MIPTAVGPVYQPFAVDLWSNLAPSRPCVQASIPKPNQTHLDHVPFPRLMNRSPICEAPTREKALIRPVPSTRCDLPLALGRRKISSMRYSVRARVCACARMCVRAFSHGIPKVSNARCSPAFARFPFLHVFAGGKWMARSE